jgi:hypothetical protein
MKQTKLGTVSLGNVGGVMSANHPPVVEAMQFPADVGIIKAGTIIGRTAEGIGPYAGEGEVIGVITTDLDTGKETLGPVLIHGGAVKTKLILADGTAVDDDDIVLLRQAGIYAF